MSSDEMNFDHASLSVWAPVSERIPAESMVRTGSAFTWFRPASIASSERTRMAFPGYGPGIPGLGDGFALVTILYVGRSRSVPNSGAEAARHRNDRRCTITRP